MLQQRVMAASADVTQALKQLVPALSSSSYKGQHGKVAVVGGCREYTGAPYFAAMSALMVGADMAYVICTQSAATAIKSYSPELMVLPYLPELPSPAIPGKDYTDFVYSNHLVTGDASRCLEPWLSKATCTVIGPGMGDDPLVQSTVQQLIQYARDRNLPLVIDGSGLNLVAKHPGLVKGYRNCILTPNVAELGRLGQAVGVQMQGKIGHDWQQHAQEIAQGFQGPVLLSKGPVDIITDGTSQLLCSAPSSLKRAGGQGDVLAGTTATLLCWAAKQDGLQEDFTPMLMRCAWLACWIMRTASHAAFQEKEREMVAGDIIKHLQKSLRSML